MTFKLALRCPADACPLTLNSSGLMVLQMLLSGGVGDVGGVGGVWWSVQPPKDTRTALCTLSSEAELEYARVVFTLCLFSRC